MAKAAFGFGSSKRTGEDEEALNRIFTPEFRNRLDAIIPFAALPTVVIHKVVQKFIMQLEAQLSERNVTFDLHEEAIAWLAEKGYDEKMGARPLARVIQDVIKKPLANEILFGKLKKGGVVTVTVGPKEDGKPGIVLEAVSETARIKPRPEAEVVQPDADDIDDGELKTKTKAKKATAAEKKAKVEAEPELKSPPKKGSAVPRVPKK
jgi:ATP-dependent Clp protease ATP-binding subunit ClpA